jgi:hypothetical protein
MQAHHLRQTASECSAVCGAAMQLELPAWCHEAKEGTLPSWSADVWQLVGSGVMDSSVAAFSLSRQGLESMFYPELKWPLDMDLSEREYWELEQKEKQVLQEKTSDVKALEVRVTELTAQVQALNQSRGFD